MSCFPSQKGFTFSLFVFQWPHGVITLPFFGWRDCWVEKHLRDERYVLSMWIQSIGRQNLSATGASLIWCWGKLDSWCPAQPILHANMSNWGISIRGIRRPLPLKESAAENIIAVKWLEPWMVMQRAPWVQNCQSSNLILKNNLWRVAVTTQWFDPMERKRKVQLQLIWFYCTFCFEYWAMIIWHAGSVLPQQFCHDCFCVEAHHSNPFAGKCMAHPRVTMRTGWPTKPGPHQPLDLVDAIRTTRLCRM